MALKPPVYGGNDPAGKAFSAEMERWWQRVGAALGPALGYAYDKETEIITVPEDTDIEGRTGEPVGDIVQNLNVSGDIRDAMEFQARPGIQAKNFVQRIDGNGTGIDVRLIPVSKGANLGSAIVGASPLSSSDDGLDAEVTISGFTVQFDFGTLAVSGGQITGLAYTTLYNIVLRGFSYTDGSWSSATAETSDADTTDDENVFYVGSITTAAAAGPPTGGQGGGGHYDP
jgi:hypothetical protein